MAECPAGDVPKLKKENEIFYDVFAAIQYGLIRQFDGGYDFNALTLFFRANEVDPPTQAVCLDMINIIICALEEVRAAERNKK